jgi:hypothetical protein
MLRRLIEDAWEEAPVDGAMEWLAEIARHDRYQASDGIMRAAETVAHAAREIGLQNVAIHRFPSDGRARFWSFQSPTTWTPTLAQLEVLEPAPSLLLDHCEQPFLLATYSAPTAPGGVEARLVRPQTDVRGAIVVLDDIEFDDAALLGSLSPRGALGFVTAAPSRRGPDGEPFSGRVELDPDTSLFAFSVTPPQWRAIADAAAGGGRARARIEVERGAPMSAVSALLPGRGDSPCGEIWLTAHLCHPRPGANDNASGVAGVLAAAATLQQLLWRRSTRAGRAALRIICAPEFVGTAAMLKSFASGANGSGWPAAVLNLDMIGEDQELCDCQFVIERCPETIATPMVPLAERIVQLVFERSAQWPGQWRVAPFLGYSDHALFAGPRVRRPAVQFAHWPDRFNHSAADTLDKVSRTEMRRAVAAAAVLAYCAVHDYEPVRTELPGIVQDWCMAEEAAAARFDSRADTAWIAGLRHHVRAHNERMRAALQPSAPAVGAADTLGPIALWDGPLNLRAMLSALPTERRTALSSRIRKEKSLLAVLANFAVRADGTLSPEAIVQQTSFALRKPLDEPSARELFSALIDSAWISSTGTAAGHGTLQENR